MLPVVPGQSPVRTVCSSSFIPIRVLEYVRCAGSGAPAAGLGHRIMRLHSRYLPLPVQEAMAVVPEPVFFDTLFPSTKISQVTLVGLL